MLAMGGAIDTIGDLITRGGWVMWPLLVLSLISATLCVERILFWVTTHKPGRGAWVNQLAGRLRVGDTVGARAILAGDSSLYAQAASQLIDREPSEEAALEAVENVRPAIERFSTTLSTIITAAPLLGILGTVTGVIASFRVLGASGEAVTDPAKVADGIAEALITTAFGLVVAMATLFPYAAFRTAADRCFSRLEVIAAAGIQGVAHLAKSDAPEVRKEKAETKEPQPAAAAAS